MYNKPMQTTTNRHEASWDKVHDDGRGWVALAMDLRQEREEKEADEFNPRPSHQRERCVGQRR